MEKITKMINYSNTLQKHEVVFVPKSSAIDFLTYCKMTETKVNFRLSNNKIMFTL